MHIVFYQFLLSAVIIEYFFVLFLRNGLFEKVTVEGSEFRHVCEPFFHFSNVTNSLDVFITSIRSEAQVLEDFLCYTNIAWEFLDSKISTLLFKIVFIQVALSFTLSEKISDLSLLFFGEVLDFDGTFDIFFFQLLLDMQRLVNVII